MKLVFGKGKASREEIEREAAREIEALTKSKQPPQAIDWSVYGLSEDVADPAAAARSLQARGGGTQDGDLSGDVAGEPDIQAPVEYPSPATTRRPATRAASKAPARKRPAAKRAPAKRAPAKRAPAKASGAARKTTSRSGGAATKASTTARARKASTPRR
jgi:hypothetical protein